MPWSAVVFCQLSELEKLSFPAKIADETDLTIKAISKSVYDGLLRGVAQGQNMDTYAEDLHQRHQARYSWQSLVVKAGAFIPGLCRPSLMWTAQFAPLQTRVP